MYGFFKNIYNSIFKLHVFNFKKLIFRTDIKFKNQTFSIPVVSLSFLMNNIIFWYLLCVERNYISLIFLIVPWFINNLQNSVKDVRLWMNEEEISKL